MFTADVLSRKPLLDTASRTRELNTREYELLTLGQLPAPQEILDRIKNELQTDPVTQRVIEYTFRTWPDKMTLPQVVRQFYKVAGELAVLDGLLFKGNRLVIPEALRFEILEKLHTDTQVTGVCPNTAPEHENQSGGQALGSTSTASSESAPFDKNTGNQVNLRFWRLHCQTTRGKSSAWTFSSTKAVTT
ncbi:uncharacterized protein ISCGN_025885 [Ixodes scapularis]